MTDLMQLKYQIEALIFAAKEPVKTQVLVSVLNKHHANIDACHIQDALEQLTQDYAHRGVVLVKTALGYRFQTRVEDTPLFELFQQATPRKLSRATLETLALIAYRQPITRSEIEAIRGVAVSAHIINTLKEQDWIQVQGYKEVPGKPALWGTTRTFLADFNLNHLNELPAYQTPAA